MSEIDEIQVLSSHRGPPKLYRVKPRFCVWVANAHAKGVWELEGVWETVRDLMLHGF
jgi:hypothetical protein